MNLNTQQIIFLQKLISTRPEYRDISQSSKYFSEHYDIGLCIGRKVEYSQKDFQKAQLLLQTEKLPLIAPKGLRRGETAEFSGLSEKQFTLAPHSNSVAIKIASGRCYDGDIELKTPGRKYLVLPIEEAVAIKADRILLIENADTFRNLEKYAWIDYQGLDVVALFRGDPRFKTNEASEVVRLRQEPTWGFYDFDPAGLVMVAALPRLERVIAPSHSWLEVALRKANRSDLYNNQLRNCEEILDLCTGSPELSNLWRLMKHVKMGLPQEWMENAH